MGWGGNLNFEMEDESHLLSLNHIIKPSPEVIKRFSCSTPQSMNFAMLTSIKISRNHLVRLR